MAEETTRPGMTADDRYIAGLQALITGARHMLQVAELVDINDLRTQLQACETLAPILEPAAYSRGGAALLREQQVFLDATIRYVEALRGLDRSKPSAGRSSVSSPR